MHDNGAGIKPEDYESIALKHYTSKLNTYDDLGTLETFGFRGEALSSLCALSNFTITTCTTGQTPKGTKLEFETSGKLKSTSVVAAQKGTTVTVEDLFKNLPVRRQELQRNIKREWTKVINVVGQYACIQTGVKITVTHQPLKGKKTSIFATSGNPTTRENVANVFGAKTSSALVALDLKLELEPTSAPGQRWSTQGDGPSKEIRILGHISRPVFGEGRQTPDKQMFFVNSRPCGLPQVAKVFNEVYRSFNNAQSPFIFANIELDTHLYDVNVSPDKRTIMLHEQGRMLEQMRIELTSMFEAQDYTVPISQVGAPKQSAYKQLTINREVATGATPPVPRYERQNARREADEQPMSSGRASLASISDDETPKVPGGPDKPVSLINKWHDNNAKDRSVHTQPKQSKPQVAFGEASGSPSKEKLKLIDKFSKETASSTDHERDEEVIEDEELEGWPCQELPWQKMPAGDDKTPLAVRQFNARLLQAGGLKHARAEHDEDETPTASQLEEAPIPAVPSPVRRNVSQVQGIAKRLSMPRRMSDEEATITIDGRAITSSLGTPTSKRQRTGEPSTNESPIVSVFGSKLSQKFAAPGCKVQGEKTSSVHAEDGDGGPSLDDIETPEGDHIKATQDAEMVSAEELDGNQHNDETGGPPQDNAEGDDYIDEDEKKAREEAKIVAMIGAAEEPAAQPSADNVKRAKSLLKPRNGKNATVNLSQTIRMGSADIAAQFESLNMALEKYKDKPSTRGDLVSGLEAKDAEESLSLTIHKSDFAKMKITGQFNLGFILATRSALPMDAAQTSSDDLFIIDQHASDEKYNFERLQASTVVQSQRLVRPKQLNLTAVEEEIVLEHREALEANGFIVNVDDEAMVGERCSLVSLPLSRETVFDLRDLEELISLLLESQASSGDKHIPRPSKVRKMFAMRACRSSVMIGKTLNRQQMSSLVRHMGEIEKPWNCPHGRPTMRHLCGLGVWDKVGWKEGDGEDMDGNDGKATDWTAYARSTKQK